MTVRTLLEVAAAFGEIRVRGPHEPRYGTLATTSRGGTLQVACSPTPTDDVTPVEVSYTASNGAKGEWTDGHAGGPILFEHTTYQLYIRGRNQLPRLRHRDPKLFSEIGNYPKDHLLLGTFNLRGQIGLLNFVVEFGTETIAITLEVVPTKLDYEDDYLRLTEDVERIGRGLAHTYARSTYQLSGLNGLPNTDIEWLTILRQSIDNMQRSIEHVNRFPYRHLIRESHMQSCHKVRKPDARLRRAIARGKGSGDYDVAGGRRIRKTVPSLIARATLDTPEHRWMHSQLSDIQHRLRTISAGFKSDNESQATRWPRPQQETKEVDVENLLTQVTTMLDSRCFMMTSDVPLPAPPSLTLLNAPGYREMYEALQNLRSSLILKSEALQLHLKDLPELYQLWCYLRIVDLLASETGDERGVHSLIGITHRGLHIGVSGGERSEITYAMTCPAQELRLCYQREYPGQTGKQNPDIVLQIDRHSGPLVVIVLDAKYRLDATRDYQKTHGSPGPPTRAMNSLHRYRDAIVTPHQGQVIRPVVTGVALFPLPHNYNEAFKKSPLYRALETLGIGALPFLPDNTGLVEEWLRYILRLPSTELVLNGPPGP